MKPQIMQQLTNINEEFYQTFGKAFAETRRRISPGVAWALENWIADGNWLDIGCGSGALSQGWVEKGLTGLYWGVDFSYPLLDEARKSINAIKLPPGLEVRFSHKNLGDENWKADVEMVKFDGVLAFAVLHHIPGGELRLRLLKQLNQMIKSGGLFIHSEWQFQNNPKLLARVQDWAKVGLREGQVEPGDTLLDWRHATGDEGQDNGLRYVHLFSREELADLALASGFQVVAEHVSDGKGGKLGLYQVWRKI